MTGWRGQHHHQGNADWVVEGGLSSPFGTRLQTSLSQVKCTQVPMVFVSRYSSHRPRTKTRSLAYFTSQNLANFVLYLHDEEERLRRCESSATSDKKCCPESLRMRWPESESRNSRYPSRHVVKGPRSGSYLGTIERQSATKHQARSRQRKYGQE